MKKITLLLAMLLVVPICRADITGLWKTIDDETGKAKSIVEIEQKGNRYIGTIRKLLLKPADTVCDECKDKLKGEPLVGMQIISDMQKDDDEYTGGEILDPGNGKVYRCKLWLEDEKTLKVRGYLAFFFRTQTWHRVTDY